MKIQKKELAQKINKLKSVVPRENKNPALQGILVKDGYLTANNMELAVRAKVEDTGGEEFIIPAKAFDLISGLPDGEVEIIPKAKESIMIRTGKIKNSYRTIDPDMFPMSEIKVEDGEEITVKGEMLLASMKRVSYAIPTRSNNPAMACLCLQATGDRLNFVGLDGHVLAWDKVDYEGEFELLIPKNAVEKLLSIGLSGGVSIRHSKTGAAFITESYEVYTRIVEGKYFPYDRMFNKLPLHTEVARVDFLDSVSRAKMCTEEKLPVRLKIAGNEMDISIKDKAADYHEVIDLQEELQEEIIIGFNAQLVIETLKSFDCDFVGVQLSGPKQPMIVEDENNDFRAIVLPVGL